MNPAELAGLFAAIFTYTRDHLHGKVAMDEIARIARAVLDQMQIDHGPVTWEDAMPLSVGDAKWRDHVYRPVRLVGHIADLADTTVVEVPTDDVGNYEDAETTCARIVGTTGDDIRTLGIMGRTLVEKVRDLHLSRETTEVLGIVVLVPVHMQKGRPLGEHQREFLLHVVDVRPSTSAMDLIGATATERAATEELLADLRARGESPLDYLHDTVMQNLGVVAIDAAEHLELGIQFSVLQAMSDGYVGHAPGRLHGMVIGPPGQGKKLIGMAARALNPTCQEGSASKVSAAGLIGTSFKTANGWTSTPGLLPLASHGVLVVQDAHGWSLNIVKSIAPIFQELMEDGEVRSAVSGGCKRVARTALLLDLNRQAQTVMGGAAGAEAAILGVLPLLSRFDTIIEIPVAPEKAWDVGERMIGRLNTASGGPLESQPWVRHARLLVAALRDKHRVIDTSGVTAELATAHRGFRGEFREFMKTHPTEASAIPVRLTISMERFVLASARANDRDYATADDVDRATRFLASKLSVIKKAAVAVSSCRGPGRVIDADFWAARAGTEVSAADVAEDYGAETGRPVSKRTVERDLHRLGAAQVAHGRWLLPPAKGVQ